MELDGPESEPDELSESESSSESSWRPKVDRLLGFLEFVEVPMKSTVGSSAAYPLRGEGDSDLGTPKRMVGR